MHVCVSENCGRWLPDVLPVLLPQNSGPNMPEVRELSEALPEVSMDPITGVGVVASRNRAPTGYDVVRS